MISGLRASLRFYFNISLRAAGFTIETFVQSANLSNFVSHFLVVDLFELILDVSYLFLQIKLLKNHRLEIIHSIAFDGFLGVQVFIPFFFFDRFLQEYFVTLA